ncbi:MAG TPA: SDR family oxidoreductase, partial [Acidimicrobiales bacterium]|nr:SDR family oxidoreductase [Acidimicrobiales bacterium]
MELRGNAVVTGANGSLGRAFCAALAARGWSVVGVDLEGTDVRLDVTDPQACRRLAEEADPQVWVNAAGVSVGGPAVDQQDSDVARMVAV